ncbi:MAG: cation diffusion facilitator family transporter [bacterium]
MNKEKAGYREGVVSIVVNIGLFALKIWAGIISHSIALTADAWHSLSDTISSVVVILAARLSTKKPDKEHPFGHGRWELIASILIGFILGVIAYDILLESIRKLDNHESADFGWIAITITVISILVNEGLAQYAFYLGRKTDNMAVKADGWHHRTDAISSVVVLAGIFLGGYFWWIDSVLGILIAVMLFYVVYDIIMKAANKLLGEKPDPVLLKKIESLIASMGEGDLNPHHYHLHNYISHKEITFHIKLDQKMGIMEGHAIATRIENLLHEHMGLYATIHIEPNEVNHRFD